MPTLEAGGFAPELQQTYVPEALAADVESAFQDLGILDLMGVEYDDPASATIPLNSGSGNTNGCDLDGE